MKVKLSDLELVIECAKASKQEVVEVTFGESISFANTLVLEWMDKAGRTTRLTCFVAGTSTPELTKTEKVYRK